MNERGGEDEGNWVEVLEVSNLAEAEIVKALLESAEIDVRLKYDATSRVILGPGSVNPWSGASVYVLESDFKTAQQLLDEALEESSEEESECDCDGE